jgi:6-phosphogluconolactonase (cycloisomerase 2 family)
MIFVQTNDPNGNQILICEQAEDGTLSIVETAGTAGAGGAHNGTVLDGLDSQGSLHYDRRHHLLFAVNAGSDTIAVLGGERPRLRQVLASGGSFPVSLTVHGDLLYVLNAHDGASISGFRIAEGLLHPIPGATRSLDLPPAGGPAQALGSPTQLGFSPDGKLLIVATLGAGSLLDVFTMHADGRPSATFKANPAGTPAPFAFTFDRQGRLLVADAAISTLTSYSIHHDGKLKQIASTPDGGAAACWIVEAAGAFYVVNAGSNSISGYRIGEHGKPSVFTEVTTRTAPIDAVVTPDERFLYVEVPGDGGVDGYRIEEDGTLSKVSELAVPKTVQGIAAS